MKKTLSWLCALVGVLLVLGGSTAVAQPSPGAPVFDYEWIKGHPSVIVQQEAVLRITMHGDMDDPTSPGLVISGFNLAIEIPSGVVDETTVPYTAGGGEHYSQILPLSPTDANAFVVGSTPVRQLSDYRLITNAYPASIHPTLPGGERDERNAMRWDDLNFIVEPLPGAPSGKLWITVTGVADRLITKTIGDIPSMTNALTTAVATNPLGVAGSTAGTSERAAFLDIKFTILAGNTYSERAGLFDDVQVFANPLAAQTIASDDHLPDPQATLPTTGPIVPVNSGSFADTDGEPNGSKPQILQPFTATLDNPSWEMY